MEGVVEILREVAQDAIVRDLAHNEPDPRIVRDIDGVGGKKIVDDQQLAWLVLQNEPGQIRPDETGSAHDEDVLASKAGGHRRLTFFVHSAATGARR